MKKYEEQMDLQEELEEELEEDLEEDLPEVELPVSEETLREALLRIMEREDRMLEEEIKRNGEHVFSERFEQKMAEILKVKKPDTTE